MMRPSPSRVLLFLFLSLPVFVGLVAIPWFQREAVETVASFEASDSISGGQKDELGRSIARAVEKWDMPLLERLFDEEGFFRRTMGGEELPVSKLDSFREGLLSGVQPKKGLIFQHVLGEEIQYLGVRDVRGVEGPLLRIVEKGGILDYLMVLPSVSEDGHILMADFYSFRSGQWLSHILRDASAHSVMAMKRTKFESWQAREDDARHFAQMKHFQKAGHLLRDGKPREALAAFEKLTTLKEDRSAKVLFLRILAAMPEQANVLEAALDQLEREEPLGTTAPVMKWNLAVRTGRLAGKTPLVSHLGELSGRDPHLQACRAQVALADGEHLQAFELAGRAIELDPRLEQGWWTIVGSGLKLRRYEDVALGLTKLDREFSHHFHSHDFKDMPVYRPFLRSDPGLEFIRSLP